MKISVIIPVYNCREYLTRCIDSVLDQTYTDFELILVDDGSSDGSGDIIDSYARRDSRVVAVHQPNQGVSAARNSGLERATGRWLTYVDSDDYVTPDYLSDMYEAAKTSGADIVVTGCRYTEDGVTHVRDYEPAVVDAGQLEELFVRYRLNRGCCVWGKLFSAECARGVRFVVGATNNEDLLYTCECLLRAHRVCLTDRVNYHYEVRGGSLTKLLFTFEREYLTLQSALQMRERLAGRGGVSDLSRHLYIHRFVERCVQSLYSGDYNRRQRLQRYRQLRVGWGDIDTRGVNTRGRIYYWLLVHRQWLMVDVLTPLTMRGQKLRYWGH